MIIGIMIVFFEPFIEEYTGILEEAFLLVGAITSVCAIIGGIAILKSRNKKPPKVN
tara:strand:+ start:82 stop:249 length:168 start_codon:yes stop_codon:yes gene_type:complete